MVEGGASSRDEARRAPRVDRRVRGRARRRQRDACQRRRPRRPRARAPALPPAGAGAPTCARRDARASADWTDVDEQEKALRALGRASARASARRIASGCSSLVLDGLGRQNCEVHEELLGAYLALLQQAGDDDAPAGWSTLAFERRRAATVRLRVRDTIGGGAETGCVLWPAALLLAGWLEHRADALAGLRVLELGAGAGLPGLVAARCAAVGSVTLTDVVPATLENLRHNSAAAPPASEVRALDWHACAASEAAGEPPVDLVLCADVVYEPTLLPALAPR